MKKRIVKNVSKMLNGIGHGQQNKRCDCDNHCLLGFAPLYPTYGKKYPPSFPVRSNQMPIGAGLFKKQGSFSVLKRCFPAQKKCFKESHAGLVEWNGKRTNGRETIAGCPAAQVPGTLNPIRTELMEYSHNR